MCVCFFFSKIFWLKIVDLVFNIDIRKQILVLMRQISEPLFKVRAEMAKVRH